MTAAAGSPVRDARPPAAIVRLTNVFMRPLLRTPIGRLVKPLALIEFSGRRTGRRRRVVVGWHDDNGTPVVITPARWRDNFENGHAAMIYSCGRRTSLVGTLDTDPVSVAPTVAALLEGGSSARTLALRIDVGHVVDADDMERMHRAVIRFDRPAVTRSR